MPIKYACVASAWLAAEPNASTVKGAEAAMDVEMGAPLSAGQQKKSVSGQDVTVLAEVPSVSGAGGGASPAPTTAEGAMLRRVFGTLTFAGVTENGSAINSAAAPAVSSSSLASASPRRRMLEDKRGNVNYYYLSSAAPSCPSHTHHNNLLTLSPQPSPSSLLLQSTLTPSSYSPASPQINTVANNNNASDGLLIVACATTTDVNRRVAEAFLEEAMGLLLQSDAFPSSSSSGGSIPCVSGGTPPIPLSPAALASIRKILGSTYGKYRNGAATLPSTAAAAINAAATAMGSAAAVGIANSSGSSMLNGVGVPAVGIQGGGGSLFFSPADGCGVDGVERSTLLTVHTSNSGNSYTVTANHNSASSSSPTRKFVGQILGAVANTERIITRKVGKGGADNFAELDDDDEDGDEGGADYSYGGGREVTTITIPSSTGNDEADGSGGVIYTSNRRREDGDESCGAAASPTAFPKRHAFVAFARRRPCLVGISVLVCITVIVALLLYFLVFRQKVVNIDFNHSDYVPVDPPAR